MKTYHIAPPSQDYTVTQVSPAEFLFETPTYDLYDNEFYINYCTTLSRYGLDLMGDGTWTGLNRISDTETDSGYVDATGRFVDTSARVDVVVPLMSLSEEFTEREGEAKISVYHSDIPNNPEDWPLFKTIEMYQEFDLFKSDRYVRFAITLKNPGNFTIHSANPPFSFAARVEIDKPVMAPMYERARLALDKLPEWMEMREIDNEPVDRGMATPVSLGGKFVNTIMGEWVDKINSDVSYWNLQVFISTMDMNQTAWVTEHHTSIDLVDNWFSRVADRDIGKELPQAYDLDEFLRSPEEDDVYFWSEVNGSIYTKRDINIALFQGHISAPLENKQPYQTWNSLDDIGVLVDLERLKPQLLDPDAPNPEDYGYYLEGNQSYKKRILDVYINKPGSGLESFKMAVRRELDIWRVYGSTPDSEYMGATPEVLDVSDIEVDSKYADAKGLPTQRFIDLVEKLATEYPTTWGKFYWGKAMWDIGGENHVGFSVLPTQLDVEPVAEVDYGIGDQDDLLVHSPDAFLGPHQFSVALKLRGKKRVHDPSFHAPVEFSMNLTGFGEVLRYDNPVAKDWVTIYLDGEDNTTMMGHVQVQAKSDLDIFNPKPTEVSYTELEVFTFDGSLSPDIEWFDKATGTKLTDMATPVMVGSDGISNLYLLPGKRDRTTGSIIEGAGSDQVDLWWSNVQKDEYNNPLDLATYARVDNLYSPGASDEPRVVIRSKVSSYSVSAWQSITQSIKVELNPDGVQELITLTLPVIDWPRFLNRPADRYILATITTTDDNGVPSAKTTGASGEDAFVPLSTIVFNGDNTWVDGNTKVIQIPEDVGAFHYLVKDDFNRPNNENGLGATLPTGEDGTPVSGSVSWGPAIDSSAGISIKDGNAYALDDHGTALIQLTVGRGYIGGSVNDYVQGRMTFDVVEFDSSDRLSIIARGDRDSGQFISFNVGETAGIDLVEISVYSHHAGSPDTDFIMLPGPLPSSFVVLLEVIGDLLVLSMDGTVVVERSIPSEFLNNNLFGFYLSGDNKIDNFEYMGPTEKFLNPVSVDVQTLNSVDYPLGVWNWSLVEEDYNKGLLAGLVDENGPWKNGNEPSGPSGSFLWDRLELTRDDFGIEGDPDWVPTWIGATVAYGADSVVVWMDNNIIEPVFNFPSAEYPENTIKEVYDPITGKHGFESFQIRARVAPGVDPHWYPQINSGYLYKGEQEEYLYANRKDEYLTGTISTLESPPRQGAPVMVYSGEDQLVSLDSFNRPNSSSVGFTDGHGLLDPVAWTSTGYVIEDGAAVSKSGTPRSALTVPVTSPDVDVRIGISLSTGRDYSTSVIARMSSSSSAPNLHAECSMESGTWVASIYSGTDTIMAKPFDYRPRSIRLVAVGNSATMYVNGSMVGSGEITGPIIHGVAGMLYSDSDTTNETREAVDNIEIRYILENATPISYRPVSFVDPSTNELSLTNTEILVGNGTDTLYAAYEDIYDVSVYNLTRKASVIDATSSSTNEIRVLGNTDKRESYRVTYVAKNSFVVKQPFTRGEDASITLSNELPDSDPLVVTYEESIYNPTTRADLPLSPLYTRLEEGFIFVSENEYTLDRIECTINPSKIVASGEDYMVINIRATDKSGNPKVNALVDAESTWGYLTTSKVSTDTDGFAEIRLHAESSPPVGLLTGKITINGLVSTEIEFKIQPVIPERKIIMAIPSTEQLPANGVSAVSISGKIMERNLTLLPGTETIRWRKGRSLYGAFNSPEDTGSTTTNVEDGTFTIGPLTTADPESPGFWFIVIEDDLGTAGDVVFWYEYPIAAYGTDDMTGLPTPSIQMSTPVSAIPPYSDIFKFPHSYDPDVVLPATPNTIHWLPPKWFELDWYLQYQLGIISGTDRYSLPPGFENDAHPNSRNI